MLLAHERTARSASRLLTCALATLVLLASATAATAAPAEYDALLPENQDEYAERFADDLIDYDIAIRFRPEFNRITGEMTVTVPNFTGQTLDDVAFRLFPNAIYYGEGYLLITGARVNGEPVEPVTDGSRTAMTVPLGEPLAPGDAVTIDLTFRTAIPENSRGTYGIFSHHLATDDWMLADWHPIVAGWDDELGWRIDPPTASGDPTFADIGVYDVTVTLPAQYSVIATGLERSVRPLSNDLKEVTIVSGPTRDLTMVITNELVPLEGMAGETVVRVWTYPDSEAQQAAAWVLEQSIATLQAYGARYGIYPLLELDLVASPVQQRVLGISWSGLVMLSDVLFLVNTDLILNDPDTARFAIVHEIGHQWWGNLIGANSNDHPFMVEGLTNALSVDVAADLYGADAARAMLEQQMAGRYRQALMQSGDDLVDQPVGNEDPNGPGRAALAYGKGALGFLAIRVAMGDDAWFAAMREYSDVFLYRNAEPSELLAILEFHAPAGTDVRLIWARWFEETGITVEDIDAVAAEIGERLG